MGMHRHKRRFGFSLIEMVFIMMIVGAVVATVLPRIIGSVAKDKAKQNQFNLQDVRDEILGYAAINGNLPVPDTGAGYTIVPQDLISHDQDAWGQAIGYIVARDSGSGASLDSINVHNATGTQVTANLDQYDTGPNVESTADVAFVIFSIGQNRTLDSDNGVVDGIGTFTYYPYAADIDNDTDTEDNNDDQVQFVTLSYLKEKAKDSEDIDFGPAGSDVNSEDDMSDFPASEVATGNGGGYITVDADAGTIAYDNTNGTGANPQRASNCIWYTGDEADGNCSDGLCDLGDGMRIYFEFSLVETGSSQYSFGSGFTFGLFKGTAGEDTSHLCGCAGHYNGWGGDDSVSSHCDGDAEGIPLPRAAVEVDVYRDVSQANDPDNDHVAILYWNHENSATDDVRHDPSPFTAAAEDAKNPAVPSGTPPVRNESPHTMRIDIEETATPGEFDMNIWVDCTDCDDLTASYIATAPTPDVTDTSSALSNATLGAADRIRFGWTFASWNVTYTNVTISNFGINFLP